MKYFSSMGWVGLGYENWTHGHVWSTLATIVADFGHYFRKRRYAVPELSEVWTVVFAVFGDCRRRLQ